MTKLEEIINHIRESINRSECDEWCVLSLNVKEGTELLDSLICPGKDNCRTRSGSCFNCIRSIGDLSEYSDNYRKRE